MTYEDWALEADVWCERLFGLGWADLCGDEAPLRQAHEVGETPEQFARYWGEKYDLDAAVPPDRWGL